MASTEELAQKAYDLAYEYEKEWGNCPQATLRALMETYDEVDPVAFKSVCAFAGGGLCEADGNCGAYVGSLTFISRRYGRGLDDLGGNPDDPRGRKVTWKMFGLAKQIHAKFIEKYGSISCPDIHRKLYGRVYYISDRDEMKKFNEAGAHDWGCTSVCGDAARWTVEVLENRVDS